MIKKYNLKDVDKCGAKQNTVRRRNLEWEIIEYTVPYGIWTEVQDDELWIHFLLAKDYVQFCETLKKKFPFFKF